MALSIKVLIKECKHGQEHSSQKPSLMFRGAELCSPKVTKDSSSTVLSRYPNTSFSTSTGLSPPSSSQSKTCTLKGELASKKTTPRLQTEISDSLNKISKGAKFSKTSRY